MNLFERWKAPTPLFFKRVIKVSIIIAAGAAAILLANPLGSMIIPGFSFKPFPIVELICKNVVVAGLVAAAIAKATKEDDPKPPYSAPKDNTI